MSQIIPFPGHEAQMPVEQGARQPMFTRRHYDAIAVAIALLPYHPSIRDDVGARFAKLFAEDNPRFDMNRFARACVR
jgi:hypothetical protein